MSVIQRWDEVMNRTSPGPGMNAKPDPADTNPRVHMKSIPNVSTERLQRALEFGHGAYHTAEGLSEYDAPRRGLVEQGMRLKGVAHELKLRGHTPGDCPHCWGKATSEQT